MKSKIKDLFILFYNFFKIGLFTFGGGQAMIPFISKICVDKYHWITDEEMIDMIAVAESTPGVIAVNMATFCGYKKGKILGSLFATLGVVLPSFIIICLISIFYEEFKNIEYVNYALRGIRCCAAILILNAGIKLLKNCNKNIYSIILILLAFVLTLFIPSIKSIYIILFGLVSGIVIYSLIERKQKRKNGDQE